MPLYELVCIAAHVPPPNRELHQLITNLSSRVMRTGGVVRDIRNLGSRTLPMRMRRHQQYYTEGDHFSMLFDTSPPVLATLNESLKNDPGVIRWTMLRKGTTIKDLVPKGEFTVKSQSNGRGGF
ncbi:hypothetical protein FFLO_05681 [Filobasidium floriforme]|uniref:Ribosomal protein S6 n=1 Tax=Filobasidium floriforme TaxID=5210 RepID=A0A8K0JGE2_9TREE|nr:uncharacterized protein HD553DRAFT_304678 [Filobasidium floriforme]KAG7529409.1 hypothetical protein FFLO_05681 [Filobasidium floriforme]KAH8089738.1 hypothetical protein HD553DRAFT_304678 [Filobasidium floriforme]